MLDPRTERRIKKLENELSDLSKLFIKTDQELRKMIMDIRITGVAGVCATEFTLANRMGITMDVVLNLLTPKDRAFAEREIDRRVAEVPDTTEIARTIAVKKYSEEGDDY